MNILILDDDDYRHMVFAERYPNDCVVSVNSYSAFVDQINSNVKWDLVHLDHDLGDLVEGDTYIDGWGKKREYNGQHAAKLICEMSDNSLPRSIIIQSVNPDGARAMLSMLQKRGVSTTWEPFSFEEDMGIEAVGDIQSHAKLPQRT